MGLRVRPITLGLRRIVMRGTGTGRRIVIRPAATSEGGPAISERRLLPNTVGTPGQTVVVNDAGTAVEYVDAPSGGGSFPTNTEPTTDPPEPVAGASWRPSDSPSLLALAADNKWRGGWLADDGTDQTAETVDPDAITWVSTTAPGTFRFGAGGITVGSLGFWLLEADPRSGSGHPGAVGSVVWSSTVGSWLRKTGAGATAWEIAGGGAALSDDDPAALGVATPGTSDDASRSDHVHPMPTAADVGALDDGAVRSIASGYAADALSDANDYTDTAVAGKQAADADLTAIAALAPSDDALIQRKAGAWTSRTPAQVKADMSIGVGDGVPVTAISTSNVSKTSNVTPAAHAQLKVALEANGLYLIRANIHYGGVSTGMVALGFSGPTGAATVGGMSALGMANGSSNSPQVAYIGTGTTTFGLGQTAIFGGPGNSGGVDRRAHAIIEAVVQMSSTAGDISVIWAQGASNVTASTVFAGSTLTVTKIG